MTSFNSGGPVIVTGGCGFFGHALVQALMKEPTYKPIVVVSRNPTVNLVEGVEYRAGSITDPILIKKLFQDVQPRVIFHTSSPRPLDPSAKSNEFIDVNINGTKILLEAARETHSVKAFVYTSSVNVASGGPHVQLTEEAPYWEQTDNAIAYWRSKAAAEQQVLAANSLELKTVALRLPLIIGPGDHAMIPRQVDACEQKRTGVQLGDGKNLIDIISTENGSIAHILAANVLLDPSASPGRVDGEAFNITDGTPISFWDMTRIIWAAAGDTTNPSDVKVIPAWLAMAMATFAEASYAIFTLGTKTLKLNRHMVDFCTNEYTYSIEKAKQRLNYNPEAKITQVLEEAVA